MIKKYKKVIIILGIIILPLLYSAFYLKAFWNPYGNLNDIPVALVNLDKCEENCKSTELIDSLKEKDTFDFDVVSEEKAEEGLVNKDYYAIIKIPEDFTSSFESNGDYHSTEITYRPNKKTNYLASQIIGSAVNEVESTLNSEVNKEITKNLTDNLKKVPEETNKVKEGMITLNDGTLKLNNGSTNLYNGLNELASGYKDFNQGINTLKEGSTKLESSYQAFDEALTTVSNSTNEFTEKAKALDQIPSVSNEIASGIDSISTNLSSYESFNNQALDDASTVYQLIINYVNANPDSLNDPNINNAYQVANGYLNTGTFNTLKDNLNSLVSAQNNLNHNYQTFNSNLASTSEVNSSLNSLNNALTSLSTSSGQIEGAISEIDNGISEINNNSNTINNALNQSKDGALTLSNGLNTLDNSVRTSVNTLDEEISKTDESLNKLDGIEEYAKQPVKVNEQDYGEYNEYGIFFAPYFMSLSLWVGGVLIMMGLYYDPDNRFKILGRNSNHKALRLLFYNIIAILQALILGFVLKLALGFTVANTFLYYGSCILVSMTFLAIIMFLFFNFKDVGRFLALVLLIIQLTACAGTFPIETTPTFFKIINPFIPMTYSVNLFRESFVNLNTDFIWSNIGVLLLVFVIFTILILITGYFKQKKQDVK